MERGWYERAAACERGWGEEAIVRGSVCEGEGGHQGIKRDRQSRRRGQEGRGTEKVECRHKSAEPLHDHTPFLALSLRWAVARVVPPVLHHLLRVPITLGVSSRAEPSSADG